MRLTTFHEVYQIDNEGEVLTLREERGSPTLAEGLKILDRPGLKQLSAVLGGYVTVEGQQIRIQANLSAQLKFETDQYGRRTGRFACSLLSAGLDEATSKLDVRNQESGEVILYNPSRR